MPRGPLPSATRRRRNAPTIPTTTLPAKGRSGSVPKVPVSYRLGKAGKAWWMWAWKTPQAAAWDDGALYVIARRAKLEDDLAVLEQLDSQPLRLEQLLDVDEDDRTKAVEEIIEALKRIATGEATLMREARELDGQLGLTPKALASLRWTIVDTEPEPKVGAIAAPPSNVRRLRAVDSGALAGT